MKLCVNCAHFRAEFIEIVEDGFREPITNACIRPVTVQSVIFGSRVKPLRRKCRIEREDVEGSGRCGKQGTFFVEKEPS